MGIYIICSYVDGSRFVYAASTDEARARDYAARVVEQYTRDGFTLERAAEISDNLEPATDMPGEPAVIFVWYLNSPRSRRTVELYRVEGL